MFTPSWHRPHPIPTLKAGGLGFMLGPTLGGHLVKDYRQAAMVSFAIQALALLLLQLLPAARPIIPSL